jgi:UDP-N-acetylmuramate dehydrogenase
MSNNKNLLHRELINGVSGVVGHWDCDLSKHSTMRLKAVGDLIEISEKGSVAKILGLFSKNAVDYRVLGWGANQLLPEKSQIPYIHLNLPFDKSILETTHESYTLPASVSLAVLSAHAIRNGLKGWEVFTGVPASLGGAIFMNAGTNLGEIGGLVKKVTLASPNGELREHIPNLESFSYRKNNFCKPGEVIVEAVLGHKGIDPEVSKTIKEYLDLRNRSQPLKSFTCGCIFKNSSRARISCRAGQFIDILGLKGFSSERVRVSQLHANFFENTGGAEAGEVLQLVTFVRQQLELHHGLKFDVEVITNGWAND